MRTGERWQHLASTGTPRLSVGGAAPLVLVACAVAMVLHQATRWGWTIDDAAICYAYARNLAAGHGLVPWPGAERVEAYSDPTWIAVLAAFQAVGLDGFTVAKPLGMLFGLPTLWLVWRLAARAMPDHRGPGALLAPIALALNAQFAIWSASGLENGLFDLLLTAAIYRTGLDRPGGIPWAAALYLLVAWTRPEGVVYAGIGAVIVAGLHRSRPRVVAAWLGVVAVPLAASELARLWYFAWPFPNTYYAKIAARGVSPLDWDGRGWSQLREWADRLWQGYWAPVYALGLTGLEPRRVRIALAVVTALAASLLWPGTADLRALGWWPALPQPPEAFVGLRLAAIAAAGVGLPLLALGTPSGPLRLQLGWTAAFGLAVGV
ncbi:MAG: hypothetical protein ABMB14_38765, partial [Myxococcota bacterium]